jgi:hypothetical protein
MVVILDLLPWDGDMPKIIEGGGLIAPRSLSAAPDKS